LAGSSRAQLTMYSSASWSRFLFPERMRIERLEKLRDPVDANFDQMLRIF
jgi:hypothetical protein